MNPNKKFNPEKLQKLNNPERLRDISPDIIIEKLALNSADIIVDIGAGSAFFSRIFFEKYRPEKLYACDISQMMVDWIKENISTEYPEIIPVKTNEDAVPLDNDIADLVFMINLHHELERPLSSLKEVFRILKTNGKLFIVDWKKCGLPDGPPEHIRSHPDNVRNQLEHVGFTNLTVFHELKKHFLIIGDKKRAGDQ